MAAVIQLGNVYGTAARYAGVLAETGEEMAVAAYTREYKASVSPVEAVLSAGYAGGKLILKGGSPPGVRNQNLLFSSFLEKEDRIDLVLTYGITSPSGLVRYPWIVFLQRACVRGWVGRNGSGSSGQDPEDQDDSSRTVYVTEYGTVYHTDPECSHIHLNISSVSFSEANASRNVYGEKYHACEKCGKSHGDSVYITSDGNRYHSSLECSGLKRTVREMTAGEAEGMRPCSKCASGEHHEHGG